MKKIIVLFFITIITLINFSVTFSANIDNLEVGKGNPTGSQLNKNEALNSIGQNEGFLQTNSGGDKSIRATIIRVAYDLKNFFYLIASVFFFVIVFKLILSDKTEDSIENFKKGVIWITIGLVIMQLGYVFTSILFDKNTGGGLAKDLLENLLYPLLRALEALVSLIFVAIAFYAFFRLVTANGDEEKAKSAKISIFQAIIGFIIVKVAKVLLETTYGVVNCKDYNFLGIATLSSQNCLDKAQLDKFPSIIVTLINWTNGFIGIITILLIIYAGFLVLTSAGDEEKLKKVKSILLYIAIGMFILFASYLILTFFILPEAKI